MKSVENPFRRFDVKEFEFGDDLPWAQQVGERAKWGLRETGILWGSCWKMLLPLMRRDGITEVIIRGPNRILVETRSGLFETTLNFDPEMPAPVGWSEKWKRPTQEDLLQGLARIHEATNHRPFWGSKNTLGDVECRSNLEDGSRLRGWAPPLTSDNTTAINIRRFSPIPFSFEDFIGFGSLTREAADTLVMAVQADCSLAIAGMPGAGSTALLQATMSHVPLEKVPVVIEESPEIQLEHWLASGFRTRPKAGGAGAEFQEIRLSDLLDGGMSARPDWIICGGINDPFSASMFFKAASSGPSCACCVYANDTYSTLTQFHSMLAEGRPASKENSLRIAIGEALRLIVVLERVNESVLSERGERIQVTRRRLKEMTEILGSDGETYITNPLFRTKIRQKGYDYKGNEIFFQERYLEQVGIPFFGLELKDRGVRMPAWWDEAQFQHVSKIERRGRVALAPDLLDLACNLPIQIEEAISTARHLVPLRPAVVQMERTKELEACNFNH